MSGCDPLLLLRGHLGSQDIPPSVYLPPEVWDQLGLCLHSSYQSQHGFFKSLGGRTSIQPEFRWLERWLLGTLVRILMWLWEVGRTSVISISIWLGRPPKLNLQSQV